MTGRRRWRRITALAWRESRTARRRLLLYMSSISLGVAALVAIDSFSANVSRSVREQSRSLLGGDIELSSRQPFTPPVDSLIDSVRSAGDNAAAARVTSFASMGLVARTGATRLVQVRAVEPGYPFYGLITTAPDGRWTRLDEGRNAIVDPALLVSLRARVGDTLTLGFARFEITAALRDVPGDVGVTAAIGPRVFIPARHLPATGLLAFGSRARYSVLFRLPEGADPQRFLNTNNRLLDSADVRSETVAETEDDLTDAIADLGDFLGVVGLVALLLGGIGVASGVHAFVMRKIDTVAVLRCLVATSGQVLAIYTAQAVAMGAVGAAAGAFLGVAIQLALPHVLAEFLPVDVTVRVVPSAVALGGIVGVWVALCFALRPLVALRHVSPLQALRRDAPGGEIGRRAPWRDRVWLALSASIIVSVAAIAVLRARTFSEGLWFAVSIGAAVGVLWLGAGALSAVARRLLRRGWPFVVRQGVANLYRPANQTRAVIIALGFGVFLISTLYQLQASMLQQLDVSAAASAANLVFFDVQSDQAAGVDSLIRAAGHRVVRRDPIVPMRIVAINGRSVDEILADTAGYGRSRWPLRREYRSTYRDSMVSSEKLVAGEWFGERGQRRGRADIVPLTEVSFEIEVARELELSLEDTVTWDVQGVRVPTRVTSLREVDWARFEPNFFAVLEPEALTDAPQQLVLMTDVPGAAAVARLQRAVVELYPNVSSLDLSLIQRTIGGILERVSVAVRFMALFSIAIGVPVVFSAVAATRRERVREGVLLKTLGATRAQVRRILLAEYSTLGALGGLTGVALSVVAAWAMARFMFEISFAPAIPAAVVLVAVMVTVTVVIGLFTGREVFAETPMAALREV